MKRIAHTFDVVPYYFNNPTYKVTCPKCKQTITIKNKDVQQCPCGIHWEINKWI